MKNIICTLAIPLFLAFNTYAAPTVVIVGSDGDGGDEFSFVLLKNFSEGEIIYFTEDEYSDSGDNFLFGEGHIQYVVPAGGLLEGDVVIITESSANTFTVSGGGGTATHVSGSGSWGISFQDEIYAYSASSASAPWNNVTEIHCFYWTAVIDPFVDQEIGNDYPSAFYLEPNNYAGNPGNQNIDFKTGPFREDTTPADLQDINNWNRTVGDITLSPDDFINNALPIELVAFDVRLRKGEVLLDWTTTSEINNESFEVEHSTDGRHFTKIGMVPGSGTTNSTNTYKMVHSFPEFGINYYRLKQIDKDGVFSLSDIKAIKYHDDEKSNFTVYPNPFYQNVTLQLSTSEYSSGVDKTRNIQVYDHFGRLVLSNEVPIDKINFELDLSRLNSGVYFIHLSDRDFSLTGIQRIIKL